MQSKAAKLWSKGESARFEFSIEAAVVVGSTDPGQPNPQTLSLAAEIKRSPSTVYDYAMVGRLWAVTIQRWPSEAETLRDEVQFGFWRSIAKLYSKGMKAHECKHWLEEAKSFDGTLEQFRDLLPRDDPPNPFGRLLAKLSEWREKFWRVTELMDTPENKRKAAKKAAEALTIAHDAVQEYNDAG